jgi:ABC-type transport system involved in multi-copper enzyme maturation permease subunit
MTWFAWRQFRTQALVVLAILLGAGVFFAVTGPHLASLYHGMKTCTTPIVCTGFSHSLINEYNKFYPWAQALSVAFPAILGVFWGAPLIARELESGTYRLAWTQGVTRSRWILTKLAVVGVASMLAAGLMSWMLTWWASPIDTLNANRFGSTVFDSSYIAPIGYAAFAFAVGVTAGVLWRRTIPAMATTIAVFIGARVPVAMFVRPHWLAPQQLVSNLTRASGYGFEQTPSGFHFLISGASRPNALVFNAVMVGKHGAGVTSQWLKTNCHNLLMPGPNVSGNRGVVTKGAPPRSFNECVHKIATHFHVVLSYQPASRFWTFQWIELSVFLAAGVALCAVSYWWVRRRIA